MGVNIRIGKKFPIEEVIDAIRKALERDSKIARYKMENYLQKCKMFEEKYGLQSEDFMQKFDAGELDDRDDFFDWYAAKRGLDIWSRRYEILSGAEI